MGPGLLSEVAHGHIQALHEKNRGGVDQNHKIAVVVQSHLGGPPGGMSNQLEGALPKWQIKKNLFGTIPQNVPHSKRIYDMLLSTRFFFDSPALWIQSSSIRSNLLLESDVLLVEPPIFTSAELHNFPTTCSGDRSAKCNCHLPRQQLKMVS